MTKLPMPGETRSPRLPLHPDIDEAMIRRLVHAFYGKVREDPRLGPLFAQSISQPWPEHLDKMCDFWSSIMLKTARFKGRPMATHAKITNLAESDFAIWLQLFEETAYAECPPACAAIFVEKASMIAESFRLGLFYRPNAIH
ncbi:group III truncated hemoglobin [Iodidimonas nitroreducens]|nr:group III truncated hemoglobin [Iodidimonas nitroreducens]